MYKKICFSIVFCLILLIFSFNSAFTAGDKGWVDRGPVKKGNLYVCKNEEEFDLNPWKNEAFLLSDIVLRKECYELLKNETLKLRKVGKLKLIFAHESKDLIGQRLSDLKKQEKIGRIDLEIRKSRFEGNRVMILKRGLLTQSTIIENVSVGKYLVYINGEFKGDIEVTSTK